MSGLAQESSKILYSCKTLEGVCPVFENKYQGIWSQTSMDLSLKAAADHRPFESLGREKNRVRDIVKASIYCYLK